MPRKLLVPESTEESPMTKSAGTRGVLCGIKAGDSVREMEGGEEEGEEMGVVASMSS